MKLLKSFPSCIFFFIFIIGALALCIAEFVGFKNVVSFIKKDSLLTVLTVPASFQNTCPVQSKQFTVNGESMVPFIKSGETIQGLLGYYNCHTIQRGDIVFIRYAGDAYPLIKFVRGIPGDSFSFDQIGNSYALKINGKVVVNSDNIPYHINDSGYRMLSLYADNYHNAIPAHAYLILGDNTNGSLDSERFGLVGKLDILGKAVILH